MASDAGGEGQSLNICPALPAREVLSGVRGDVQSPPLPLHVQFCSQPHPHTDVSSMFAAGEGQEEGHFPQLYDSFPFPIYEDQRSEYAKVGV